MRAARRKIISFSQEAFAAREEGVERVLENEPAVWKAKATRLVATRAVPIQEPFLPETLRLGVYALIGEPHHPNVWSALWGSVFKRHGLVVKDARLRGYMRTTKSHGRDTALYWWGPASAPSPQPSPKKGVVVKLSLPEEPPEQLDLDLS